MPIRAIENRRLYRQIADQITELIDSGEISGGDRLPPERTLAEKLKVSRASVREALIALEIEGAIEVRGGTGVFVINRELPQPDTSPGPFEILRVRRLLEPEAAALAAQHAGSRDISEMQAAQQGMRDEGFDQLTGVDHDRRFHMSIADAAHNSALTMCIQLLWEQRIGPLYIKMEQHFHNPTIWQRAIDQHQKVLDAIIAHDASAARKAMAAHIDSAEQRFASHWVDDPVALGKKNGA